MSSLKFVVGRMVLKKASTSPAAPGFPTSGVQSVLYNATSFVSRPYLRDRIRLPSLVTASAAQPNVAVKQSLDGKR